MKNAGLTLFFFFGLMMTQVSAQNCTPSPNCSPACCAKACNAEGKSAAVDNKAIGVATFAAALNPAQMEACKAAAPAACSAKSDKSAALTSTAKATTVSNKMADGQSKKACTAACTKAASTQEQ